jgi:LPPG:FO 2-phospho-L-lactate transferase
VVCPSNPWVSIDPILAVPGIQSALTMKRVVAVSPIINGKSVKGPVAKMYAEMGIQPSALAIAHHYGKLLTGFIMDTSDSGLSKEMSIPIIKVNTLMKTKDDRQRLAEDVLNLVYNL